MRKNWFGFVTIIFSTMGYIRNVNKNGPVGKLMSNAYATGATIGTIATTVGTVKAAKKEYQRIKDENQKFDDMYI